MEEKIITVADYKRNLFKVVKSPTGAVFKIKKLTTRDYLKCGSASLFSTKELLDKNPNEKKEILLKKISDEDREKSIDVTSKIIVKGVVEPELTLDPNDKNKLDINDLLDEDFNFLASQISEFSFGNKLDMQFFRSEPTSDNTGQLGEKIQDQAVNTAQVNN